MILNGLIPGFPKVESFSDFITGREGRKVRYVDGDFEFEMADDSDAIMFKMLYQGMDFGELMEYHEGDNLAFISEKYRYDHHLRSTLVVHGILPSPWQ
jgi:hypothetical protein